MQTELLNSGGAVILSSPPAESPTGVFVPVLPGAPLCFIPSACEVCAAVSVGASFERCSGCAWLLGEPF